MTFSVNTNFSYHLTFSVAEVLHSVEFMPRKKKENYLFTSEGTDLSVPFLQAIIVFLK